MKYTKPGKPEIHKTKIICAQRNNTPTAHDTRRTHTHAHTRTHARARREEGIQVACVCVRAWPSARVKKERKKTALSQPHQPHPSSFHLFARPVGGRTAAIPACPGLPVPPPPSPVALLYHRPQPGVHDALRSIPWQAGGQGRDLLRATARPPQPLSGRPAAPPTPARAGLGVEDAG